MAQFQSVLGVAVIIGLAWALSSDRGRAPWRFVALALGVQAALAVVLTQTPGALDVLNLISGPVRAIEQATQHASAFVFGHIGGGPTPYEVIAPGVGFSIAFQVLPIVIVVSSLTAVLWHWGILAAATRAVAWALKRSLGIGGALGLGAAANLFLGVIEAPLFIRAALSKLSRADLFAVMVVGLSTVAGTVFVLYATVLAPVIPNALAHIIGASVMSLPAALLIARLMEPAPERADDGTDDLPKPAYSGAMDAIAQGAADGMKLFLNIVALLLVIVALVRLTDLALAVGPDIAGGPLTVQRIFGWLFAPLVWLFGVPWEEAATAGGLMGTKAILNEFFAYLELASLAEGSLSERSRLIMIYAMCGFANLGSIGILIAGIATLAPERRADVAALGLRAWLAGNLATGLTGATIGALTPVG